MVAGDDFFVPDICAQCGLEGTIRVCDGGVLHCVVCGHGVLRVDRHPENFR